MEATLVLIDSGMIMPPVFSRPINA